jgi:hypothetical protein
MCTVCIRKYTGEIMSSSPSVCPVCVHGVTNLLIAVVMMMTTSLQLFGNRLLLPLSTVECRIIDVMVIVKAMNVKWYRKWES